MLAEGLCDLFTTDVNKSYHIDGVADIFHRGVMVKVLAVMIGLIVYKQNNPVLACIVPGEIQIMPCNGGVCPKLDQFCWSLGVYIYKELMEKWEDGAPYFAVPKDVQYDGLRMGYDGKKNTSDQCSTTLTPSGCYKMKKIVIDQYKYLYFKLIMIMMLFSIPFLLFTKVNSDLVALYKATDPDVKLDDKEKKEKVQHIMDRFMNKKGIQWYKQVYVKMIFNIAIKFVYIAIYPLALVYCDVGSTMSNNAWRSINFGFHWLSHSTRKAAAESSNIPYPYVNPRVQRFPPFGLCDIQSIGRRKNGSNVKLVNIDATFVCEVSPHNYYTFFFLLLWVLCSIGLIVAVCNCLYYICYYGMLAHRHFDDADLHKMFENLKDEDTALKFRRKYYLDYIKNTNIKMYKAVKEELKKEKEKKKNQFNFRAIGKKKQEKCEDEMNNPQIELLEVSDLLQPAGNC